MKKKLFLLMPLALVAFFTFETISDIWSQNRDTVTELKNETNKTGLYRYPEFYKGIYLTIDSARNTAKLTALVNKAKAAHLNTMVLDIQLPRSAECMVPKENVDICLANGIHPIARIVVFADGLKKYPVPESDIQQKLQLAEKACQNGFKEIQFDYIRFDDYGSVRHLTYDDKYNFIEGFLSRAKNQVKKYDVKTAADVFGRIPLNTKDSIGQRMEGLDKVVDIICPMAYPSHYTWSKQLMGDPYHTVFITSKKARERTKNAEIVTYIQAFKMKLGASKLTYDEYIAAQIRAVHDAGVKGFIMWNARQDYDLPFSVAKSYYEGERKLTQSDKNNGNTSSL